MPESARSSAESEPWWPEFVSLYKQVPLRELARRFDTNPRRLRRAAQRSGLEDEPEVVQEAAARLGRLPDASLADELGVSVEVIQGARTRRHIAAFNPSIPPPKPPRAPRPPRPARAAAPARKPRVERFRPDPEAVEVVRVRTASPERREALPKGASLERALGARPSTPPEHEDFEEFARRRIRQSGQRLAETLRELEPPAAPASEPAGEAAKVRRRRRIVPAERLEELRESQDDPEPAHPLLARRRAPAPPPETPEPVARRKPAPPPVIEIPVPSPPPRAALPRRRPEPSVRRPAPPPPAPEAAPQPSPQPEPAPPPPAPVAAPQPSPQPEPAPPPPAPVAAPLPAPPAPPTEPALLRASPAPSVAPASRQTWRVGVSTPGGEVELLIEAVGLSQAVSQAAGLGAVCRVELA